MKTFKNLFLILIALALVVTGPFGSYAEENLDGNEPSIPEEEAPVDYKVLAKTTVSKPSGKNGNTFKVTVANLPKGGEIEKIRIKIKKANLEKKYTATFNEATKTYQASINIKSFDYKRGKYYITPIIYTSDKQEISLNKTSINYAYMTAKSAYVAKCKENTKKFTVKVKKIKAPAGITKIRMKVKAKGIVKWYTMKKVDGVYKATVKRSTFKHAKGKYEIKIYGYDKNNVRQKIKEINRKFKKEALHVYKKNGKYYIDGIIIVNKKHKLPKSYSPGENKKAAKAFKQLISDMREKGYDIGTSYSGYRSYNTQKYLFNYYVNKNGRKLAERESARPGHSEHQTGLAFDVKHKSGALVRAKKEANWIKKHAHEYGFIVRYQPGKEKITGYKSEPWHLRYVGSKAIAIKKSGKSLEEYYGFSGGDYKK